MAKHKSVWDSDYKYKIMHKTTTNKKSRMLTWSKFSFIFVKTQYIWAYFMNRQQKSVTFPVKYYLKD